MHTLIESHPNTLTSVVLAEKHLADLFAAQAAVDRVLDGSETRGDFSDEDMLVLHGLAIALEEDTYVLSEAQPVRLIPPRESQLLLGAVGLFASMPEAERADLLTQTEYHQAFASKLVEEGMRQVTLDAGVSPAEALLATFALPEPLSVEEPIAPKENLDRFLYVPTGSERAVKVPEPEDNPYDWPDIDWPTMSWKPEFAEATAVPTDDQDRELISV